MLKFLADECCDAGMVAALRAAGHDIHYILENKAGTSDDDVYKTLLLAAAFC